MGDKDYVLVIHGTWNPPDANSPKWHQLNESEPTNFCTRLNDELEKLGLGRAVWRALNGKVIHFGWTGDNVHKKRVEAASDLCELFKQIVDGDPSARIHVVAHSHGANVTLLALRKYLTELRTTGFRLFSAIVSRLNDLTVEEAIEEGLRSELGEKTTSEMLSWPVFVSLKDDIREFEREQEALIHEQESNRKDSDIPQILWKMFDLASRSRALKRGARTTSRRFRSKFVDAWMVSNESNRIGRLVFMGAPFLSKVWMRGKWWAPGVVIGHTIDLIAATVMAIISGYILVELVWTVYVWGFGSLIRLIVPFEADLSPTLDPRDWSTWLVWLSISFLVVYAIIYFSLFEGWKRRNVNPYFDATGLTVESPENVRSVFPFKTLIVHAGMLDEVFLGFATEPLVYGTLVPQLRSLLYPALTLRFEDLPLGLEAAPRNYFTRALAAVWNLTLAVMVRLFWPLIKLWERLLTGQLLALVASPSFGFPTKEFTRAMIVPSRSIEKPMFFDETHWDVGSILMNSPLLGDSVDRRSAERYSFLWDTGRREALKKKSWLWSEIERSLVDIESRYRSLSRDDREPHKQRLVDTCLVLEERIREVAGAVELVHSAYYSNVTITERVAHFIAGEDAGT